MSIADAVRQAALHPALDLPDPPPEHPYRVIRRDGYVVGVFAGMSFGNVQVQAIAADDVQRTVDDARAILAAHGKSEGAWFVPEAAQPAGLVDELRSLGMTRFTEPPLEPRFAALVAVVPPESGTSEIEARLARTFDEFQASSQIVNDAFEVDDGDRRAFEAKERLLWEIEAGGGAYRTFVAFLDGAIVGSGGAINGANATYLSGGSTRADMRGKGVYRALVRARWDAAVARGTPALTVSAGRMSLPILQRLGFVTVGWVDCLHDRFG